MSDQNELNKLLVQLHIAEYQALTNRNTNWSTIQLYIFSLIVAFITFMVLVWNKETMLQTFVLWGGCIIVQLCLLQLYFVGHEIYRNVYYIEGELRRNVSALVRDLHVWRYEQFLVTRSGKKPIWTDITPTILFLAAFGIAISLRHQCWDVLGVLFNLPFAVILIFQTIEMVKLRRRFEIVALAAAADQEEGGVGGLAGTP